MRTERVSQPARLAMRLLAGVAALAALAATAADARGGIDQVRIDSEYVATGQPVRGAVVLDLGGDPPRDAALRLTILRDVDVPTSATPGGGAGAAAQRVEKLADQPLAGRAGRVEVPFEVATGEMLFGAIRVRAELLGGGQARPLSMASGEPAAVGVRPRVDLAGDWEAASVKVLEGDLPRRKKDWQMPPLPATIRLPGVLGLDEGYRGWLTLRRKVSWRAAAEGLAPRFLVVDGASDSAAVRINGAAIGETTPAGDYASLTHWLEYHSPYKGPENRDKRYLLMAEGCEYPSRFHLPKALPAEGSADFEIVLRSTSGGILGRPMAPYGILNGLHLELAPAVCIRDVTFDASKPAEKRRVTFRLNVANDSGQPFRGRLRAVYGRYAGRLPYSGPCPAFDADQQELTIPPGGAVVEVIRDEPPRFATCRATFLVLDAAGKVLDAAQQDYHAVTVEIRDRRDLYLNNERFLVKFHGSWGEDAATRLQLKAKGANGFRAHKSAPSARVAGFITEAANIDDRCADGLLTSAGGALLASCEKCTFWDPADRSNIHKAVRWIVRRLGPCPGIIEWEATNELHGEPEEARVEILRAFHAADPYHRPVMATKASGEWEAEAREGRVAGVDIVGCQYLLSPEAADSIAAAVTEQPIMSTEVNWNDQNLAGPNNLFTIWLNKGLCGSLLFDYSGNAMVQGVPPAPPPDSERDGSLIRASSRSLYQDLVATAAHLEGGRVKLTVGNRMPYALRGVVLRVAGAGRFDVGDLASGDAAEVILPESHAPPPREPVGIRAEFTTHGGLPHLEVLAPTVQPAAKTKGGAK